MDTNFCSPDGETIYAFHLVIFVTNKFYPGKTGEELIKEVKDIIDELNDIRKNVLCA